MENTLENKTKFFALFWGQKVFTCSHWKNTYDVELYVSSNCWDVFFEGEGDLGWNVDDDHLLLKSLSLITDEDGIWIAKQIGLVNAVVTKRNEHSLEVTDDSYRIVFIGGEFNQVHIYKHSDPYWPDMIAVIDLVRSKGYALPYMGVSVKTLIEWGWIKLIES